MRVQSCSVFWLPILAIACFAFAGAAPAATDGTLLVMTRPHADIPAFEDRLVARGFAILREIHCRTYGYSIFQVQPKVGSADAALETLKASKDADLYAAEPTFESELQSCVPDINDPDRDVQWHLDAMNFDNMRCLLEAHDVKQTSQPRVTLVDSGILAIKKELNKGKIREFNFVGGVGGVEEVVFVDGAPNHHGTAVASVAAATTNNAKFLASPASSNKPVKITICRISDDGTIDTLDVLDAMTWCVDNQEIRGGPGAINLSINSTELPTYNGSSVVQEIARSAYKQGDLFVNGAGNTNIDDPSPVKKQFRVIVGLDDTQMRWVDDETHGSVYGDFKAAAPCTDIPYLAPSAKAPFSVLYATGTSLAAPCWASCIALLMSLDPALTAPKADKIVFKTATITAEGYHLPDLYNAVNTALELEP